MITKAKNHIKNAFDLISAISVHGDTVDVMAQARNDLRTAYATLLEHEKTQESEADPQDGEEKLENE